MYLLITFIRKLLYDLNILKSKKYDIPIISVGNITVGGTGKTPHIEYFIREFLDKNKRVAVVSRGYKRKSKGFILADSTSNADIIGDEPFQIFQKFPQILVAVDKNRINAVEHLLKLPEKPDVILLDDAFQYRKLIPQKQTVLVDYNRPIFDDRILPYGRLRESRRNIKRANEVIVTKCPENISHNGKEFWKKHLNLPQNIKLKFSTFEFFEPKNIFTKEPINTAKKYNFLVVTGVVNADSLYKYLTIFSLSLKKIQFADHHNFTQKDIFNIEKKFAKFADANSLIIVTEKDAARLVSNRFLSDKIKEKIYSVEIKVKFL